MWDNILLGFMHAPYVSRNNYVILFEVFFYLPRSNIFQKIISYVTIAESVFSIASRIWDFVVIIEIIGNNRFDRPTRRICWFISPFYCYLHFSGWVIAMCLLAPAQETQKSGSKKKEIIFTIIVREIQKSVWINSSNTCSRENTSQSRSSVCCRYSQTSIERPCIKRTVPKVPNWIPGECYK